MSLSRSQGIAARAVFDWYPTHAQVILVWYRRDTQTLRSNGEDDYNVAALSLVAWNHTMSGFTDMIPALYSGDIVVVPLATQGYWYDTRKILRHSPSEMDMKTTFVNLVLASCVFGVLWSLFNCSRLETRLKNVTSCSSDGNTLITAWLFNNRLYETKSWRN